MGTADSLRRAPVVVAQQSAEAFASSNRRVVVARLRQRDEQPIVEALAVAIKMIVGDEACSNTRS